MRTLIFQHTPEEIPGTLEPWLRQKKFVYEICHVYREPSLPSPEKFDWLVVLGGPMNLDEETKHPWLKSEKKFIASWLEKKKPYLGLCLGGQLLAQALGGNVTKNNVREIGWHAVARTESSHPALVRWPNSLRVFQWHEDRFSLPPGCEPLITSTACQFQAFSRDARTLGFQFHPESVESWIEGNFVGFEPTPGEPYVQTREECLAQNQKLLPPMTSAFHAMLDDFVASF